MAPGQQAHPCAGAIATAQLVQAAPVLEIAFAEAAALATLAHPLIAGALSVLAFTRAGLGSLRFTRDLDITGDVCAIKLHGVSHQHCPLHAVPAWARPLLAGARAHHRLTPHPPGDSVFAPSVRVAAESADRLTALVLAAPHHRHWLTADMAVVARLCGHSLDQTGVLLNRLVVSRTLTAWHHQPNTDEVHWQPAPLHRPAFGPAESSSH
ncbi:hypothetical protein [Streptomyces sp. BK205]|uniref:hypothetical protein n=1 Tax=Streptomyces sp. BK205 TaxID=2512164 RepID=UPI001050375B|nr:hypothetical protein [Streptomyces sp. BK205]TCR16062.1 hypothetical protein EV578_115174 [Streptomyces sp. BK205]